MLLQHAIDSIASTFYTQVMFADFELQAHRLVEQDQPITAEVLSGIYAALLREYYGDVIDEEPLSRVTWARIPHFFSTPYYVYQYATCFASTARLMQDICGRSGRDRAAGGVERYLSLLRAGGSDYPMDLLARGGGRPEPARHGAGRGNRARHARRAARGCVEIGREIARFDPTRPPRCIITSGFTDRWSHPFWIT